MSGVPESGSEAQNGGEPQILLFCHQCQRSVRATPAEHLQCPDCQGEFVEEIDDDSSLTDFAAAINQVTVARNMRTLDVPSPFNFYSMVQNRDFVIGVNFADFMIGGNNLEQLMLRSRYGSTPASKAAVDGMPTFKITEEHVGEDASSCAVCKEEFALQEDAKQMPCKHIYHPDCILPWLKNHNTCPLCRFELAVDEPSFPSATGVESDLQRIYQQMNLGGRRLTPVWGNEASGSREDDYYDSLTDVD